MNHVRVVARRVENVHPVVGAHHGAAEVVVNLGAGLVYHGCPRPGRDVNAHLHDRVVASHVVCRRRDSEDDVSVRAHPYGTQSSLARMNGKYVAAVLPRVIRRAPGVCGSIERTGAIIVGRLVPNIERVESGANLADIYEAVARVKHCPNRGSICIVLQHPRVAVIRRTPGLRLDVALDREDVEVCPVQERPGFLRPDREGAASPYGCWKSHLRSPTPVSP